ATDPAARGWWAREHFHLRTRLDRDALLGFFLEDYAPSPIIAPRNAGSGFYYQEGKTSEKDPSTGKKIKTGMRDEATAATKVLDLMASAEAKRFQALSTVINQVRGVLKELGYEQAPADKKKQNFVALLRSTLPDRALDWLDAALALSTDELDQ